MGVETFARPTPPDGTFRHEAFFYDGDDDFVEGTTAFIREGVTAGEPTLVVVSAAKIHALQRALGTASEKVHFADMADVGRNPARIIPAWRQFVADNSRTGRTLRGVGEPIGPSRSPEELVECHRHEALLNVAFDDGPAWWLLCPYDTSALHPAVVGEARRTHPHVVDGDAQASPHYGDHDLGNPFSGVLAEPAGRPVELDFGPGFLGHIRGLVAREAEMSGLNKDRGYELVMAVNEVVTNSLEHGGGRGRVRIWPGSGSVICEVQDAGLITDPLVGRRLPDETQPKGRGLWLANQLCDLVQLRSSECGTTVRLHMSAR
jgi:anti-sigma regulatory factor (Ser/Thr protein kinase)